MRRSPPDYLLLTDADIVFAPGALSALVARAEQEGLVLNSLMVKLRCKSFAERMFVPAFVFFFQMLYPFAWVNDPRRATAAAAGGCMLVKREALQAAGGLAAIRGALIDDCALAKLLKARGPIALALTDNAHSLRAYPSIGDIRRMVARTAYAQLRYSPLVACRRCCRSRAHLPGAGRAGAVCRRLCAIFRTFCLGADGIAFRPILRFYGMSGLRSWMWAAALPAIAAMYMAFTLNSAYQHARGRGGMWKGRAQANI